MNLADQIKIWGTELGFSAVGITDYTLREEPAAFENWLERNTSETISYMHRHLDVRKNPIQMMPNTKSIICVAWAYSHPLLKNRAAETSAISNYALVRDYHRVIKEKLNLLAARITKVTGPFQYRACVDTAPVLEKSLAAQAGLGWIGKNTLLLNQQHGSWIFLGELFTDLILPFDSPVVAHCGKCQSCVQHCPTGALTRPYEIDVKRCIAYLTISYAGVIPEDLRPLIGTRIFGCDSCQEKCPWNQQSKNVNIDIFESLLNIDLITCFQWSEKEFLAHTEQTPIAHIPYERFLRNVAVALGNSPKNPKILAVLKTRENDSSPLLQEHVAWAIQKQLQ